MLGETERRDNLYFLPQISYEARDWPDPPPPPMHVVWRAIMTSVGVRAKT